MGASCAGWPRNRPTTARPPTSRTDEGGADQQDLSANSPVPESCSGAGTGAQGHGFQRCRQFAGGSHPLRRILFETARDDPLQLGGCGRERVGFLVEDGVGDLEVGLAGERLTS